MEYSVVGEEDTLSRIHDKNHLILSCVDDKKEIGL